MTELRGTLDHVSLRPDETDTRTGSWLLRVKRGPIVDTVRLSVVDECDAFARAVPCLAAAGLRVFP